MIIEQVRITALSAPLHDPVPMSFAQLASRNVVLIEVESEGVVGIGESWVNHPAWAATERVATLEQGVVPLLRGLDVSHPRLVQTQLASRLAGLARQWGAQGPIWQALSCVDMALWDLLARHRGVSVAHLLSTLAPRSDVEAYASGIGPSGVQEQCTIALDAGFRSVKARVGFGHARDEETLTLARATIGDDVSLFVDANQAWSLEEALDFCAWSVPYEVGWVEEPLAGNQLHDLKHLADVTGHTLACGENLYGVGEFLRYAGSGALGLIQPDLAKSGGFTLASALAGSLPPGVDLVPHSYGGAVVNAASIQLAAAFHDIPYIEVDVRPNPLRDAIITEPLKPRNGRISVPRGAGLGVDLDPDAMDRYIVDQRECDLHAVG